MKSQPEIINRLVKATRYLAVDEIKRVRLAVSPQEYTDIREWMLSQDMPFWARIADIPLVIEDDPESPTLTFETPS